MRTAEKKYRNQGAAFHLPASIGFWVQTVASLAGFWVFGLDFIWIAFIGGVVLEILKKIASRLFSALYLGAVIYILFTHIF